MATPILRTKLYRPPPRPALIPRRRLVERLHEGKDRKLVLISAPAGFGKTTLVSEWITELGRPAAWLSLEAADNDPSRFLAYVLAALQTVEPALGESVLQALQSIQSPPPEHILTIVINDIGALEFPIVLVLDDFHLVDSEPVTDAVAFLIEHLPPQLRLVITTREDPRLPLPRLRARDEMTELRAADLRFTDEEAAAFLKEVMGLDLSAGAVSILGTRTEGWVAGLQLAALSMRGRDDLVGFIDAFAGDDRYVVDYLVEEVLQRQPQHIRDFLLETSFLDRMSGELCEAVTGRAESKSLLEFLERGNLFVIPLDDKRQWFRYHHLFADVLRAHAMEVSPSKVASLHLRASDWFERQGMRADAIRHAFAAGDVARAANLVELAVPWLAKTRQEATLLAWLRALPDAVVRVRPVLSVGYAGALLQGAGDLEGAEARLQDAERWLEHTAPAVNAPDEMVVTDTAEFLRLPGQITIYRAAQALIQGDVGETMRSARQAFELLAPDDDFGRGAAAGLLGLALWTNGDLEGGHRTYTECMNRLERAGFISDIFGCALVLADIRKAQGRLHDAMATYQQAFQRVSKHSATILRGMADMHVGMADIYREWDDLDAAKDHLQTSKTMGDHNALPQNPYRWCVVMARVREAEGDLAGAIDLLDEAERLYVGDFSPNVRPVPALRARLWATQGRIEDALDWARTRAIDADDEPTYLHEYEHITLAALLIGQYRRDRDPHVLDEALELLQRLLLAAEDGGRIGSAIEILVLRALALEARGEITAAWQPLERALSLAAPEGYVRVFAAEGEPMARLLADAAGQRHMPDYVGRLMAACSRHVPATDTLAPSPAVVTTVPSLLEPLSPRELEVLHLVAQGLSNEEIGDRLFLALSTVKGHNRTIFGKLGVQRRTEAVARARDLGLL